MPRAVVDWRPSTVIARMVRATIAPRDWFRLALPYPANGVNMAPIILLMIAERNRATINDRHHSPDR